MNWSTRQPLASWISSSSKPTLCLAFDFSSHEVVLFQPEWSRRQIRMKMKNWLLPCVCRLAQRPELKIDEWDLCVSCVDNLWWYVRLIRTDRYLGTEVFVPFSAQEFVHQSKSPECLCKWPPLPQQRRTHTNIQLDPDPNFFQEFNFEQCWRELLIESHPKTKPRLSLFGLSSSLHACFEIALAKDKQEIQEDEYSEQVTKAPGRQCRPITISSIRNPIRKGKFDKMSRIGPKLAINIVVTIDFWVTSLLNTYVEKRLEELQAIITYKETNR